MHNFNDRGRREANWLTLAFAAICTVAVIGEFDPVVENATKTSFIVFLVIAVLIVIIRRIKQAMAMHHALYAPLEVLLREDEEARKNESP